MSCIAATMGPVHSTFTKYAICDKWSVHSLVPRPRPAFRHLQYVKTGRAWYLFSREHDVISKLQKFAELTGCISRICNQLRIQRSVCKTIASRYPDMCGKLPCTLALFTVLGPACPRTIKPFLPPFLWKAGRGLGMRLVCPCNQTFKETLVCNTVPLVWGLPSLIPRFSRSGMGTLKLCRRGK